MSHITKVQIPLKDLEVLQRALEELGLQVEQDAVIDSWTPGETQRGDLVVRTPAVSWSMSGDYGIAFEKQSVDGSIEVHSDWEASMKSGVLQSRGLSNGWRGPGSEKVFLDAVGQKYTKLLVTDRLTEQGFTLGDEKVEADGTITLTSRRYR